jgi:hypothetical protein
MLNCERGGAIENSNADVFFDLFLQSNEKGTLRLPAAGGPIKRPETGPVCRPTHEEENGEL